MGRSPGDVKRNGAWRGRVVVLLVLAPSAIVVAGLVVWLAFFPPFGGT